MLNPPGAMFDNHPAEGETPSFKGSALIVAAETVDEVKAVLAGDIYSTSGVWNVENASIVPVCFFFSFLYCWVIWLTMIV